MIIQKPIRAQNVAIYYVKSRRELSKTMSRAVSVAVKRGNVDLIERSLTLVDRVIQPFESFKDYEHARDFDRLKAAQQYDSCAQQIKTAIE